MSDRSAALAQQAIVGVTLLLVPMVTLGQDTAATDQEALRLEMAAERFEARARVLTLFDRDGKVRDTVGERGMYFHPTLSPDGKRIAVIIADLFKEQQNLWVIDIATGDRTRITAHADWDIEWAATPVWSPDGSQLAYVGMRDGYEGVYRKSADGQGEEELLYRHPGAEMWLGDWSIDGRYVSVSTASLADGYLYVLPMDGNGERDIIELLRRDTQVRAGSFSPDAKLLSYMSNESGDKEVYVRELVPDAKSRQISDGGGLFPIRASSSPGRDEFFYLAAGERLTAASVDPDLQSGSVERSLVFDLSLAIRPEPGHVSVSRDGKQVLIAVPHAPKLEQIAVFDRQGNELQRLGEPGVYRNPTLSPDGSKVAVLTWVADTDDFDIWTFDRESGASFAVTDDAFEDNWPIWSPDGLELAYRSERGVVSRIYRKPSDGTGEETEVFEYELGAFLHVTDWSDDGKFISFNDGCWGVLYIVPLNSDANSRDRKAMEWLRDEYQVALARFSPDSRYIAYLSDEIEPDIFDIYIAPFDPSRPNGRVEGARPVRLAASDVNGMVSWREDGRELYYLTKDWEVMAIELGAGPEFESGKPRKLFELPGPLPGNPKQWKSVTPDGQKFVFVLYVPVSIG